MLLGLGGFRLVVFLCGVGFDIFKEKKVLPLFQILLLVLLGPLV